MAWGQGKKEGRRHEDWSLAASEGKHNGKTGSWKEAAEGSSEGDERQIYRRQEQQGAPALAASSSQVEADLHVSEQVWQLPTQEECVLAREESNAYWVAQKRASSERKVNIAEDIFLYK